MSAVIAFCERHNIMCMLNLLRNIGQPTCMQEVFALDVLEQMLVSDPEKMRALKEIRAEIHPVTKLAQHRAAMLERQAEIVHKESSVIPALNREIEELQARLDRMRLDRQAAAAAPQPAAPIGDYSQETQQFDTQLLPGDGNDSDHTQPENPDQYAEVLGLFKQGRRT